MHPEVSAAAAAGIPLQRTMRVMLYLLALSLACAPGLLAVYLHFNGGPQAFAKWPDFHVFIITLAILFSGFVSFIAWTSYRSTGKAFQKWLFLGLAGFTFIYAPHGFLTNLAGDNIWLFILYGPVSRLVMGLCFLQAVLGYGKQAPPAEADVNGQWLLVRAVVIFLAICVMVAVLANMPFAGERIVRWSIEGLAIAMFAGALLQIRRRHLDTRMMRVFAVVLLIFMQSSIAFLFPMAWSHSWWYAHVIFAAGFGLLSYQVGQVYLRTGAFEDVFSEDELLEGLRRSNANYEQLLAEQGQVMHIVSHDLQIPLRKASLLVSELESGLEPGQDSRARPVLAQVNRLLEQMTGMVTSLMRQAEIANAELVREPVNLNRLIASVFELFEVELRRIGAVVRNDELPTVSGDPALLFEVFQNLLQNAIRFRRDRPMLFVLVYAEQHGAFWRIAFQDNGRGFRQDQADEAFRMLGRLDPGSDNNQGAGMGLTICREIIERHGGSLSVNAEPDRGAIFYIDLPVLSVE